MQMNMIYGELVSTYIRVKTQCYLLVEMSKKVNL